MIHEARRFGLTATFPTPVNQLSIYIGLILFYSFAAFIHSHPLVKFFDSHLSSVLRQ